MENNNGITIGQGYDDLTIPQFARPSKVILCAAQVPGVDCVVANAHIKSMVLTDAPVLLCRLSP